MPCRTPCNDYDPNNEHSDCKWSNGEECMMETLTKGDIIEIKAKMINKDRKSIKEIEALQEFVVWMNKNLIFGKHFKMIPENIVNIYLEDKSKQPD